MIKGLTLKEKDFNKVDFESIANTLGIFLEELYEFDIKKFDKNFSKEVYIEQEKKSILENCLVLMKYLNKKEINNLEMWQKKYFLYLEDFDDYHLTHGDLWYENYIISRDYQNLVGIVDFEKMRISDPASDLAALYYLPSEFIDLIFFNYHYKTKNLDKKIKLYREVREIRDFKYIVDNCNDSEVFEQLSKIRNVSGLIN